MRQLEALTHFFYNGQRTIEVLNTAKDIERKEAQKEKRKKQNMNMLHYRDILQKQYRTSQHRIKTYLLSKSC